MKPEKVLGNQSGTILVIALLMMMILTLITLSASSTAILDNKLSGNKKTSTAAFYAAESGIQATESNIAHFSPLEKYVDNKYNPFADSTSPNPTNAKVIIKHEAGREGAPRGMGMSAINFEFEHYVITSTGQDEVESGFPRSTCTVEEKVVELIPTQQGGY